MGEGSRLVRFSCWCPKVMAAIGHLPETLADRCIVIRMQRKTPGEECEKLRNLDGSVLRRKCARFVKDHGMEIASARPALPPELNDRAGDVWEPLLAIADLIGGTWPERAREAATGLTCVAQASSPLGALLTDLRECFEAAEKDRLFSRTLVEWLRECKNRPWIEMGNGRQITELWLSHRLRPYGIRPKTMWIGEQAAKGYLREDFGEVFRRYLTPSG